MLGLVNDGAIFLVIMIWSVLDIQWKRGLPTLLFCFYVFMLLILILKSIIKLTEYIFVKNRWGWVVFPTLNSD